jgi:diguanylate cyclase (GGDEF)-like protein
MRTEPRARAPTSVTPKQAPELPHAATRPTPLAALDGELSTNTAPKATAPPAWPGGLAGLTTLLALLATALGSAVWLGLARPAGLDGPRIWPAVALNIAAVALLSGYAALLIRQLRRQRIEIDAAMAQVHQLAAHDELTGLWNRRHAQQAFQIELQRASRSKRPLCLALVDIDNLKQINDQRGHAVGDEVLRAFALEACVALRKTDLLARWGGEEFLILLPETKVDDAMATLERLRQRIDDASIVGLAVHAVTVSIGITLHGPDETLEATLDRANHALYIARVKGHNRVASV